jgi:hypothetical protein
MTKADPIFATIEAHRKAAAALTATVNCNCRLEEKLGGGKAYDGDAPEWIASNKAETSAWRAAESAALRLVRVAPTTVQGAAALLAYYADTADHDRGCPIIS